MKYIPLFILIQIAAMILALIGLPICAVLAYGNFSHDYAHTGKFHWPQWAWLWDNDEDGTFPEWYHTTHPEWSLARTEFMWTALRNSVNNFRFVPGVSKKGRPMWIRNWTIRGKTYYAKAGWNGSGYPVISAGRGQW